MMARSEKNERKPPRFVFGVRVKAGSVGFQSKGGYLSGVNGVRKVRISVRFYNV